MTSSVDPGGKRCAGAIEPAARRCRQRSSGETGLAAARFLHRLTPITIAALLVTLVLLFSFKGDVIVARPLTILWIAVPLFLQTCLIFGLGWWAARRFGLRYADAAPTALIGASNHFEVAIATAVMLFGLASGAALATVVGVLIEVPTMLLLVRICLRGRGGFPETAAQQQ